MLAKIAFIWQWESEIFGICKNLENILFPCPTGENTTEKIQSKQQMNQRSEFKVKEEEHDKK